MEAYEHLMGIKDLSGVVISVFALSVSMIALYLSHWHKSSKALLCLSSRFFDAAGDTTKRELNYTFSNVGNQELYIKHVSLLRGPSPLGNLKDDSAYLEIPSNVVEPFVIKPGEIWPFTLSHDATYSHSSEYDRKSYKYTIVSLEIISANGNRYQVVHDITVLGPSGPDMKDKIWRGVPLGSKV